MHSVMNAIFATTVLKSKFKDKSDFFIYEDGKQFGVYLEDLDSNNEIITNFEWLGDSLFIYEANNKWVIDARSMIDSLETLTVIYNTDSTISIIVKEDEGVNRLYVYHELLWRENNNTNNYNDECKDSLIAKDCSYRLVLRDDVFW